MALLTKKIIIHYLKHIRLVSRNQLIEDLKSIGLQIKGASPDGRFIEFINQHHQVRVKLHASDKITDYYHIHLYDYQGNSLNAELQVVSRKSPDAHIKINEAK